MYSPKATPIPGQLHATLPGPNGTRACLTLYNACPHTSRSAVSSLRSQIPYLHHDLPPLPPAPPPQTIEYIDNKGRNIVETTRTALLSLPKPRRAQLIEYVPEEGSRGPDMTLCPSSPTEAAMIASSANPVLVKSSAATPSAPALRSILKADPWIPTVYLLSFSTDRTPTTRAFATLLNKHLPAPITLQYTIDARSFRVPATHICENYSGVAAIVQDEVLRDTRARQEVDHAVDELTRFVRQGGKETGIAICCTAGTHRSVAIAELIALGVREKIRRVGSRNGVKVVARHIHRMRGSKDPY